MEDHQSTPASSGLMELNKMAVLVWQHNVREARADSSANVAEVNAEIRHYCHIVPSAQGWSGCSREQPIVSSYPTLDVIFAQKMQTRYHTPRH